MLRNLAILAALCACVHSRQPTIEEFGITEYSAPIEGEAPAMLAAPVQKPVVPEKVAVAEQAARQTEAPPPVAEVKPVEVKPVEPVPVVAVPTASVYFAFDRSSLNRTSRAVLDKVVEAASAPGARVRIEGHCDERGSNEYNLLLGQRRADSAKSYLVRRGVPADNVTTLSFGEDRPKMPGHDESSWRENRRDDVFVEGPPAVSQR